MKTINYLRLLLILAMVLTASARNVPLIVGGVESEKGEFPFIVGLRKTGHYCGASIINSEWIVTAAHCSTSAEFSYSVVAGDHINNEFEGTEQNRSVSRIVVHPLYNAITIENDIALMQVSFPFEFNDFVQPIELAPSGFVPTPKEVVAGWGRLTEGGTSSTVLMKVEVPYVSDEECRVAYGDRIKDSMTCAGEEGQDACQGDSGGPLICQIGENEIQLCGLVSWGTGCGRSDKFGVYCKISHFTDWISSVIA